MGCLNGIIRMRAKLRVASTSNTPWDMLFQVRKAVAQNNLCHGEHPETNLRNAIHYQIASVGSVLHAISAVQSIPFAMKSSANGPSGPGLPGQLASSDRETTHSFADGMSIDAAEIAMTSRGVVSVADRRTYREERERGDSHATLHTQQAGRFYLMDVFQSHI
jgi:hypothetical protein